MSKNELIKLSSFVQEVQFPVNTLVIRQDDLAKQVYFIKSGGVKLIRKVDYRIPKNAEEANSLDFLIAEPTDLEYVTLSIE